MANNLDLKLIVKHLANGSFGENLCRVCLAPLTESSENVFTSICKEGKEYCIADVLKELCDIKITDSDHYNVCPQCFIAASNSYKFYLNTKANDELLHYYTNELERHVHSFMMPDNIIAESVCISLPAVAMDLFDYDIKDMNKIKEEEIKNEIKDCKQEKNSNVIKSKATVKAESGDDEDVIIVMNEKGKQSFYKMQPNGELVEISKDDVFLKGSQFIQKVDSVKKRKKREPMVSKRCTRCPIKYRFIAKLKEHMKREHGIILYSCKICQALTEDVDEYNFHMKTHTNTYECDICYNTFKKRETIIFHLQEHGNIGKQKVNCGDSVVCTMCGVILEDEDALKSHMNIMHHHKYTCYYCGRKYKGEISFDKHIKKHEMYQKSSDVKRQQQDNKCRREFTCDICGRGFLAERGLLWHTRLHTNERPFVCEVCGRGFVSVNRRNQHTVCAHTAPRRRCPLCPALFHLRSMVNTHLKKVHLKADKRRTRAVRQQTVHWPTETVPIQELSVAIQNDILELQAAAEVAESKQENQRFI